MNILDEAVRLTTGDRHETYGPAAADWTAAGRVLGAYLDRWLTASGYRISDTNGPCPMPDVPAHVVAWFMAGGIKGSREMHRRLDDNSVDAVGYIIQAAAT